MFPRLMCCLFLASLLIRPGLAATGQPDFARLGVFALLAEAAYLAPEDAAAAVEVDGYRLSRHGSVAGVAVNWLLVTDPVRQSQVVVVRGTANVENAIVDVSLQLQPDAHAGVVLHQGFSDAAEGVYRAVRPLLDPEYTTSTTGHSLGGAVAAVLAMYLDVDGHRLGPVITFGQPKITNVAGAKTFAHLDLTRVVTEQDPIPLVPPLDVVDIRKPDIYWHLGREVVLLEGPEYAELEGLRSMLRATRVFSLSGEPIAEVVGRHIGHHRMSAYVAAIQRKLGQAKPVPYETGINLWKLMGGG